MALDVVWRLGRFDEQVLRKRRGEYVYGQDRRTLVGSSPPPLRKTCCTDGAEHGGLDGHVEGAGDTGTLEELGAELASASHKSGHLQQDLSLESSQ